MVIIIIWNNLAIFLLIIFQAIILNTKLKFFLTLLVSFDLILLNLLKSFFINQQILKLCF